MSTKHTPGPWAVSEAQPTEGGPVGLSVLSLATAQAVCDLYWRPVAPSAFPNADANALLIAAAPELLEAGRELVEAACNVHPTAPSDASIKRLHAAIDAHGAAIAKAEGTGR